MKTLKEAAKEYLTRDSYANGQQDASKESFIDGDTSKHVEREKLKFAIEQIYKFIRTPIGEGLKVIGKLEQQLKELEK